MAPRSALLFPSLLVACVAAPLGDDWAELDPAARDARAVEVLRDLFAARVDGAGRPAPGLDVVETDARGIAWRTEHGETCRLRWLDVESVEHQVLSELPARPESLYLQLRPGSPSAGEVQGLQRTLLGHAGVTGPYLHLPQRPARSRERLLLALDHLRARALTAPAVPTPAPAAPAPSDLAPVGSPAPAPSAALDEAEALLRRLADWERQGLITPEEHARKRREVLDGLGAGAPRGGGGE